MSNNTAALLIQLDDLALAGRTLSESYDQRERQVGVLSPDALTALLNFQALFQRQEDVANCLPFLRGAKVVRRALALPSVALE